VDRGGYRDGVGGRSGLVVVARAGVGLVAAGMVLLALTYRMEIPAIPLAVFLFLALVTAVVGVVLCVPFLEVGGRGFVLGSAAGNPGRLLTTVCLVGAVGAWVAMMTSHGEEDRVFVGISTFFVSGVTIWCSGASRPKPDKVQNE
jgi:hypothetical protein